MYIKHNITASLQTGMEGLFQHDASGGVYRALLDPSERSSIVALTQLKAACGTAYEGVAHAWRQRSEQLKNGLLRELRFPNNFGSLWCFVIPNVTLPQLPRSGGVVRLVCANSVLGDEQTFFTFRTQDSFVVAQPDDQSVLTLHRGQFVVVWMAQGEDMNTGEWTTGRALEMDAVLGGNSDSSGESSDETQIYEYNGEAAL